jgi:nicotinamide riboside kinase
MRVAFTGSSSTGKTTLAKKVVPALQAKGWGGRFLTTNARGLLQELGHAGVDAMDLSQKREFQRLYLDRKLAQEQAETEFITDRSFVDVAAYWIEYNGLEVQCRDDFIERCRESSVQYDAHFYFPVGLLPLHADGFRSTDETSRQRIDGLIQMLAAEWGVECHPVESVDLPCREEHVVSILREAGC